jgi:hypothetical protein
MWASSPEPAVGAGRVQYRLAFALDSGRGADMHRVRRMQPCPGMPALVVVVGEERAGRPEATRMTAGNAGQYLSPLNCASLYGLSLPTFGRECDSRIAGPTAAPIPCRTSSMPSVGVGRMRGNPAVKTDSFGHEILSQLAQLCGMHLEMRGAPGEDFNHHVQVAIHHHVQVVIHAAPRVLPFSGSRSRRTTPGPIRSSGSSARDAAASAVPLRHYRVQYPADQRIRSRRAVQDIFYAGHRGRGIFCL